MNDFIQMDKTLVTPSYLFTHMYGIGVSGVCLHEN